MQKLIDHYNRYKFVLNELVKKGIKLRYRRSYLGVLWTMLEPLLTMLVLYFVFGSLLGRANSDYGGLNFAVYILSGRLIYTYFNQSTKECTRAIRTNAAMIKKVHIPKYLFPLSNIIFNYILFAISLIVLFIVATVLIIRGSQPMFNLYLLQMFIPLITLFLLTLGAGLFLSTIGAFFRDMEYLWNVFMMLVFYSSAIFYSLDKIINNGYATIARIMQLNPLYCIIANFRECLMGVPLSWKFSVYSLAFSLVLIAIGTFVFRKNQDKFILHV